MSSLQQIFNPYNKKKQKLKPRYLQLLNISWWRNSTQNVFLCLFQLASDWSSLLEGAGNDYIFMVGFLSKTSLNYKFYSAAKHKAIQEKDWVHKSPWVCCSHFARFLLVSDNFPNCHVDRGRHSCSHSRAPWLYQSSLGTREVLHSFKNKPLVLKASCLFWEIPEKIFESF